MSPRNIKSLVNFIIANLDKLQYDAFVRLVNGRTILVEELVANASINHLDVVNPFMERLQDCDIITTLEILYTVKEVLEKTSVPPGCFVNDTMVLTLRYLLSVNSHGVVTCALDFLKTLLDCLKDNLFTLLYMKIMLDKVDSISLQKFSLDYSVPANPPNLCAYKLYNVPENYEDLLRPYKLARSIKEILKTLK